MKLSDDFINNADIEVDGLAAQLGNKMIFSGVSFKVKSKQMVAVVGPNGAGKTTLIRVLAGLLDSVKGTIKLMGKPFESLNDRQRAKLVAVVGQQEEPAEDLFVSEIVLLGLLPHRPPWAGAGDTEQLIVEQALNKVGLDGFGNRLYDRLSGGEQRRVLVARAIAQSSPILILDEPTNHLDIKYQHLLLKTVKGLDQTVLAAIHDLNLAMSYFDQVIVINHGKIQAFGLSVEVLTPKLVSDVFGIQSCLVRNPETGQHQFLFSDVR